ncbi:bucentaur or craniofacial development-domain-containing protein [Phaeosphaeriaceae sp. PMI808]|nr:bucentaur or craniofacial development-domain-containing protein [Phaeosphaeriaceae sp. PMI808]
MAPRDYEDDIEDTNEKYHESDDEDFNPDTAPPEEVSSESDNEDAPSIPTQRKGKRKAPVEEELDSGDEVTIQNARRKKSKKQKKGKKANDEDDELILSDDDGEGGLIKTRAQRKVEKVERRPLARTEGATVDVDALWAQMIAPPVKPTQPIEPQELEPASAPAITTETPAPTAVEEEEQVSIKKTYTFAGQDTTEEKSIPQSHLDKYLSSGWKLKDSIEKPTTTTSAKPKANTPQIRRPLRRPSRFDSNPTGYVRTLAPEFQLTYPRTLTTAKESILMPPPEIPAKVRPEKTQKLNVVDKSRMDWTGFVDKEGIAEELNTHGKTKEAYLGRMEFLAGVEARREEERKKAKVASGMT